MKKIALLFLCALLSSGIVHAVITKCSIKVSGLQVKVTQSSSSEYTVRFPRSAASLLQVSEEDEHLYISEARLSSGEELEVVLPEHVALELDVSQSARVYVATHSGRLISRVINGGTVHLGKAVLSSLVLEMVGSSTFFAPDCVVQAASLFLEDDADALIERVTTFTQKHITTGARVFVNNECLGVGLRRTREEFSLAGIYRHVSEPLTKEMSFYGACAIDPLVPLARKTNVYAGNPLLSANDAVKNILTQLGGVMQGRDDVMHVLTLITALPDELAAERTALGVLLCRRVMLCTLALPLGPGAISPRSLWALHPAPSDFTHEADALFTQMYDNVQQLSRLLQKSKADTLFGPFGSFYQRSARALNRLRSRVLNSTSRGGNRYRWVPFLEHFYTNIDTFVCTGHSVD